MAYLNHMGPEEKGPKTVGMLGKCHKNEGELKEENKYEYGIGRGKTYKRKSVKGQRLKSLEMFD